MYPPPSNWNRAPDLVVDQDFDHYVRLISAPDASASSVFGESSADGIAADISWVCQASGESSTISKTQEPYHKGILLLSTSSSSGFIIAVGLDLGTSNAGVGSLTTPLGIATGDNVYKWEWLINVTSVANVNYRVGLGDSAPIGTANNAVWFNFDTSTDANWHITTIAGGSTVDTNTNVAAATGWHRFVGELKPRLSDGDRAWHFYLDHVLIGTQGSGPSAPVTMFAAVRTRTAGAKTILVDRARLWTDGHNQIFGGVA
jgi:hypothetical protein